MVLLLVFMHLTRDLFAIAKFLFKLNNTHQSETLHSNVILFRLVQYSKSFAKVLLVSAVEEGAIIIEHPVH